MNDWLAELEEKRGVEIFYACEAGSRAWGGQSEESDYDIRFIYRHKSIRDYLSLREPADVLDFTKPYDAHGWDIRKALKLLKKSNPSLFEWAFSPIVYLQRDEFLIKLKEMITAGYSPYVLFQHYINLMSRNLKELNKIETVSFRKQKQLIQAARAFLIARELCHRKEVSGELLMFHSNRNRDAFFEGYELFISAKKSKTLIPLDTVSDYICLIQSEKEKMIDRAKALPGAMDTTASLNNWLWELLGVGEEL